MAERCWCMSPWVGAALGLLMCQTDCCGAVAWKRDVGVCLLEWVQLWDCWCVRQIAVVLWHGREVLVYVSLSGCSFGTVDVSDCCGAEASRELLVYVSLSGCSFGTVDVSDRLLWCWGKQRGVGVCLLEWVQLWNCWCVRQIAVAFNVLRQMQHMHQPPVLYAGFGSKLSCNPGQRVTLLRDAGVLFNLWPLCWCGGRDMCLKTVRRGFSSCFGRGSFSR